MKNLISCMLALLMILACTTSCKLVEDDPTPTGSSTSTDTRSEEAQIKPKPLTFWNTYIMQDASTPFTYFACGWNHPIYSSKSTPCSAAPEVIAEVLRRLRTLTVTEAQKIDPESVEELKNGGISEMSFREGSLSLEWLGSESTDHPKSPLHIRLSGDVLILYFDEANYACYRLDSDKTEFKSAMVQYAKEHDACP